MLRFSKGRTATDLASAGSVAGAGFGSLALATTGADGGGGADFFVATAASTIATSATAAAIHARLVVRGSACHGLESSCHFRSTQQRPHAPTKRGVRFGGADSGPLHGLELRRHRGVGVAGGVDHHRQQKRFLLGHWVRALGGEFLLEAKIAFEPFLRPRRDHWDVQRARRDLPTDLRIPRSAATTSYDA